MTAAFKLLREMPLAIPATVGIVTAAGAMLLLRHLRGRRSPDERERRRRIAVNSKGRLVEATVFSVEGSTVHYGYEVAGVAYDASQDLVSLLPLLPEPIEGLIGTATAKFDRVNPANSILICENWSGFPKRARKIEIAEVA